MRGLRQMVVDGNYQQVVVHTSGWINQLNPQLFLGLLAATPAEVRAIADDRTGRITRFQRPRLVARSAAGALGAPVGIAEAGIELIPRRPRSARGPSQKTQPAVLAIWPGPAEVTVGGSVTHMSGILSGYREHGLSVGVVALATLPPQIAAVVDEVEIVRPLRERHRTTAQIAALTANHRLRDAAGRLAQRLPPTFVHQRHSGFLHAGVDVGRSLGVPVVLEWNSSERWTRKHWTRARIGGRLFDPFLPAHERRVLRHADVVAAVSPFAREMAIEAGASPGRVIVVPNGVDPAQVAAARSLRVDRSTPHPTIGWVGSFGPWHGADLLVHALLHLPADVRLLMIGDGSGRAACEDLARKLGVHERVEWPGTLAHEHVLQRLVRCAVLASPQRDTGDRPFFGSPTKLFEFLALGRPVVATRVGAVPQFIDNGRTGLLVDPDDPRALAEGLDRILNDAALGDRLASAAHKDAADHHTWRQRATLILRRLGDPCAG